MKESFFSRVSRIISASTNSLIDGIETSNPELIIKEATREIESAIDELKHEIGKLEAQRHLASRTLAEENAKHDHLQSNIEIAIDQQRDDLAKAAIEAQMDIETQLPLLERVVGEAKDAIEEHKNLLSALKAKQREMQTKLIEIKNSKAQSENGQAHVASSVQEVHDKVAKADSAYNRVLEGSGLPHRQDNADAGKIAELEELARNNRISERLAAIKSGKK